MFDLTILLYTIFFDLSIPKGVIFINFKKKFLRVLGYIVCALLFMICIVLIISAAAFGARNSVNVFGYNIYIVQKDDIEGIAQGSAVIVRRCSAGELVENNMLLYMNGENPDLGYIKSVDNNDYGLLMKVQSGDMMYEVPEANIVGLAEYNSKVLGSVIGFIKTPIGVFCIAVLPCLSLILYDILRALAAKRPMPEVEPQVKNVSLNSERMNKSASAPKLSVNSEGKASYAREKLQNNAGSADKVLFNYSARQRGKLDTASSSAPKAVNRGAVPKDDAPRTPMAAALGSYAQNSEKSSRNAFFKDDTRKKSSEPFFKTSSEKTEPKAEPLPLFPKKTEDSVIPKSASVGTRRASDKVSESSGDSLLLRDILNAQNGTSNGKTAERALVGRQRSNAFFAQTSEPSTPPQINISGKTDVSRQTSGRRSSQILASKRMEDLISDEDDERDRAGTSDSYIDDILSGLDKKK